MSLLNKERISALKFAVGERDGLSVEERPAKISYFLPYGFHVRFNDDSSARRITTGSLPAPIYASQSEH